MTQMGTDGTGRTRGRGLWLIFVSAVLGGCAGGGEVARVPQERPGDLMVAATVLAPVREGETVETKGWPRSLRPARFVIEADGCLRAATGSDVDSTTFPARTRQLSGAEMDQLWRQFVGSGLLEKGVRGRVEGPESGVSAGAKPTALIYASWGDTRQTVRVVLDRSNPEAVEAERVVDRLAALAWQR